MKSVIIVAAIMALGAVARADIDLSSVEIETDQVPLVLLILPDGSGPGFAEARCEDGTLWGRAFRVRPFFMVWGGGPDPVFVTDFPAEDVMLVRDDMGLACPGHGHPDGPSDDQGWFTWTMPVHGGGGLVGAPATLWVAGQTAPEPLPLAFVSPDFTGDNLVNLSDISVFTQSLLDGGASSPADLNVDGVVNLSDVALFTPAIGVQCPARP